MAKVKHFNIEQLARYKRMAINTMILVVAFVLVAIALWGGDSFIDHVQQVPPKVLVVLMLASLVENVLRIYRYKIFAKVLKLNVPWPRMVLYYVAGMALLPTPGKVGVVLRLWLLHHHHGILYRRSAPLLIMDLVTDTLAMMLLIVLGIMGMGHVKGAVLGLLLMGGVMGALVVILVFPKLALMGVKMMYRVTGHHKARLFAGLQALVRLLHRTMSLRVLAIRTSFSFVAWGGFGLALSYAMMAMGYDPHWLLGGFAVSLSTVMGVASMMPAGVGGAEASMAGVIVHMGGVPWATALILTVLVRTALIWIPVIIGFIALPWALQAPAQPAGTALDTAAANAKLAIKQRKSRS